jgi:beta-glucosidase
MSAEITNDSFPPSFLWGVAIGAHQTEGGNLASDWWFRENQPNSGVAERNGDAVDGYHRYREDISLAASAGFTDYRFGIEWSRIEPSDGFISTAEVDHYRRVVRDAVSQGLRPFVTLYHFSLPLWFAQSGGWRRPDAVARFLKYVDALGPVLSEGVARVMTINEPNIYAVLATLGSTGASLVDGIPEPDKDLSDAMIAVHRATVTKIRADHPGLPVGWGVSVQDYQPAPGAEDALERYAEPRDQVFIRASAGDDFVGVQTYTGGIVSPEGLPVTDTWSRRTMTGWAFTPGAVGGAVRRVSRLLPDVPILVSENGVAVANDRERIEYVKGALDALRSAMDWGANVIGYFHWSLLDNWEWGHWGPTFGLVAVDRATFERIPKPSLAWLGSLAPQSRGK